MVANKYAFLQITRRRFLNEWEAFKKVISRRNIRRRITIPLTLSNLKLLRRITRTENILHRNFTRRQVAIQNRVASNIGISQRDRKSGSAGMPRPISYAVFCLKSACTSPLTLSLHDALPIWEAFKKVISRRNIRRRITIPLTLSNLKLLRRITRTENILHRNFTRRQVAIQNRVASNIGISQSTFSVKVLNLFSRS